jgi:nicotinic acid mononucleotide adenylyltransferase
MGFLSMPEIDVSSSEVREWICKGEPVDGLVGSAVAAYIAQHGLYCAPPEATAP